MSTPSEREANKNERQRCNGRLLGSSCIIEQSGGITSARARGPRGYRTKSFSFPSGRHAKRGGCARREEERKRGRWLGPIERQKDRTRASERERGEAEEREREREGPMRAPRRRRRRCRAPTTRRGCVYPSSGSAASCSFNLSPFSVCRFASVDSSAKLDSERSALRKAAPFSDINRPSREADEDRVSSLRGEHLKRAVELFIKTFQRVTRVERRMRAFINKLYRPHIWRQRFFSRAIDARRLPVGALRIDGGRIKGNVGLGDRSRALAICSSAAAEHARGLLNGACPFVECRIY